MHIALLSAEYPPQPGGVGDYTLRLGTALAERGHTISVLTTAANALAGQSPLPTQAIAAWGWRSWREVVAALNRLRPDVLHIQYQTGAYGMHPAINLLPWRLRGLSQRPHIAVTAHDLLVPYLFPKAGPLRGWMTRRLLRDADAVVVTNEADFAQVAQWRAARMLPVVIPIGSNIPVAPPHGYDRADWRARLGLRPAELLVAYFGLISRSKGLDVLIGALGQLPEHFRLLVVGGTATASADRAYAEEVYRRIDAQGLRHRVIITGHCAAAEVSAHLLAADLGALPFADGASSRRGSLLALLAHGLPTVTTLGHDRTPRMPLPPASFALRPLVDGESALLVPPSDAAALVGALVRLADDPALRERLAAGGRAWAAPFAWQMIAAQHEALYARMK
jgi:glycosyltransferase involved in cell wall biosynthesis